MEKRVSTIIIEPRLVLREALELLMGSHSYRVVCGVGSIEQIACSSVGPDGPSLVILGAQSGASAAKAAASIRELWPNSKIIFLFDRASASDFHDLLVSEIDGCIPLFVSADTLISTLDLIVSRTVRVMVVGDMKQAPDRAQETEHSPQSGAARKPQLNGSRHDGMPVAMLGGPAPASTVAEASNMDLRCGHTPTFVDAPRLSDRETQILDGLVKGYANKVIARRCDITEATVKVHMKSILRKIRVGNRTQAAIWAFEHGYCNEVAKPTEVKDGGVEGVLNGFTVASGEKRLANVQE